MSIIETDIKNPISELKSDFLYNQYFRNYEEDGTRTTIYFIVQSTLVTSLGLSFQSYQLTSNPQFIGDFRWVFPFGFEDRA